MKIVSRLFGLLMIVRVLGLPIILFLIVFISANLITQLDTLTQPRRDTIETHLNNIQENTEDLAGWVGNAQNAALETFDGSFGYLANLLEELDFDNLPLPSFTVPESLSLSVFGNVPAGFQGFANFITNFTTINIPFAAAINTIPQKIEDAVSVIKTPLERLAKTSFLMNDTLDEMQLAKREMDALIRDIEAFFNGTRIITGQDGKPQIVPSTDWLGILRLLLMLLGGLLIVWYVTASYHDLILGWKLLRGQPI